MRFVFIVLLVPVFLLAGYLSLVLADAPVLIGLDPNKPMILPMKVQAAYNDDTMFFDIEWEGDRGDTHDLVRFSGGAWQNEGGPRRDAQATIDQDPARGATNVKSTNYESRVAWMINDPNGPNAISRFSNTACFCTCHDKSRAMPEWDGLTDFTKYLRQDPANPNARADLWHHRQARANPIGMSDDQVVVQTDGTVGGRRGDGGVGAPYETNSIVSGAPRWLLNNEDTVGKFAVGFEDIHTDPNHNFMRAGDNPPVSIARALDYQEALNRGYVPQEGDTVPRQRLRDLRGTPRGDITALDSSFMPTTADQHFGVIESSTQRLLNTGDPDDTALADGGLYDIAFAIHTGMVTVRDHYVSFPLKLSMGGGAADVEAVKITGSGRDEGMRPDFSNTTLFPETLIELFLPGITSLEFLLGENEGKPYRDPATGLLVDQVHAGAAALHGGGTCSDCHTTSGSGLSMENLVPQRGGVWTPTPLLIPEPSVVPSLIAGGAVALIYLVHRKHQKVQPADEKEESQLV